MDANHQRCWSLADEADLRFTRTALQWDRARRTLRLASVRERPAVEDEVAARARLAELRNVLDRFGNRAWWEAASGRLMASGVQPSAEPVLTRDDPSEPEVLFATEPSDFAVGHDGVLHVLHGDRVSLIDLRARWAPLADAHALQSAAFQPWRLAALPSGGVVVLDRAQAQVARVVGSPLPRSGRGSAHPGVFRPDPENPNPPRLTRPVDITPGPAVLPTRGDAPLSLVGLAPVAIAASSAGRVAVLAWRTGADALLILLDSQLAPAVVIELAGSRFPYSFEWIDERHVAVMVTGLDEARVYVADAPTSPAEPEPVRGDVRPLQRGLSGGAFAHALEGPPFYPDDQQRLVRLHRISVASLARRGMAENAKVLDSGHPTTVWHRLYLEAAFPRGTGLIVELAASDDGVAPPGEEAWFPHRFGGVAEPGVPQGAWVPMASELPFHPGFLPCTRAADQAGLFTALVQRRGPHGRRVTALTGRYLHVRIALEGDGRSTPEVAALRAYGSRFSYVDRYLPALYRERVFGPDADAESAVTTRADFTERFLGNFEGVLTPLEDRIAAADLLTDARTVPPESLAWLASWVGFSLDAGLPAHRQRALLASAMELHRWRGTKRGLELCLDLATDGGVTEGHLVVVEHWRLRRTLATILGADLADELDPLTGHFAVSGNSVVGETLVLGSEQQREFLSLFRPEQVTASEELEINRFFEQFAHRVTVLVQAEVVRAAGDDDYAGRVRRVVQQEAPVHLDVRVVVASHPLVVGLRALVGVDTYLGRRPSMGSARIDVSRIGERDVVRRPPSLDPRLEGGA